MKEKLDKPNGIQTTGDIVDLILEDHKPLKELIKILKDDDADMEDRVMAFEQFAPQLISHAKPEEESLYNFMKENDELRVEGMEGETEHEIADRLVNEIYETGNKYLWSAKVKVLAELVEHHIKVEEKTFLPDFKKHSTESDRMEIGRQFLELKNTLFSENFEDINYQETIEEVQMQ